MDQNLLIVSYSLILIFAENVIGSFLHGMHIPMAGQLLSINQIGLMSRIQYISQKKAAGLNISLNATLLKSLSPAGKKLTPMLALLTQGVLFSIPSYIIGINILSLFLGIILSAIWAFVQPALLVYIFIGNDFIKMINKILSGLENYIPNFQHYFIYLLIVLIILKVLLSLIYSFLLIRMTEDQFSKRFNKNEFKLKMKPNQSHFKSTLKELLNPLFIISILFTTIFLIWCEASTAQIIWGIIRPIAIGFLFFYLVKIIPDQFIIDLLKKNGLNSQAEYYQLTIQKIKSIKLDE